MTLTNTTAADLRSASDLMNLDDEFSSTELEVRAAVREFVDRRIRPNIADWFDHAVFPVELVPEMAELGLLGMHLEGFGCAGRSAVEYGIAMQELEAGDSGIRTFVSVQGSLAMSAIRKFGSEEQKTTWLPRMARGGPMPDAAAFTGRRQVYFGDAGGFVETSTYARDRLSAGNRIAGPALIEEHASTTVLSPGDALEVDDLGNLVIAVGGGRSSPLFP